jgi:hypothetical protein
MAFKVQLFPLLYACTGVSGKTVQKEKTILQALRGDSDSDEAQNILSHLFLGPKYPSGCQILKKIIK